MAGWRNRIIETRTVTAEELRANPNNWRQHGSVQKQVLEGILQKIGIVDSLLAYYSARAGGALTLINGHLRQETGGEWPVEISDLNDEEADLILATFDPSSTLAEMDSNALAELLGGLAMEPELDEGSGAGLAAWLEELRRETAVMESTQLADAQPRGAQRGNYGTVVKLVLVAGDVYDVERALAATTERNRAQALLEVCRHYLETHAKGQQYTAIESLVASQFAQGS